jgi:hypothetical protein
MAGPAQSFPKLSAPSHHREMADSEAAISVGVSFVDTIAIRLTSSPPQCSQGGTAFCQLKGQDSSEHLWTTTSTAIARRRHLRLRWQRHAVSSRFSVVRMRPAEISSEHSATRSGVSGLSDCFVAEVVAGERPEGIVGSQGGAVRLHACPPIPGAEGGSGVKHEVIP